MGDTGLTPGSGRSPGERNGYPFQYSWGFPGGSDGKESACSQKTQVQSGRSPGEENGYPLQYSCLENSMDRGVHGVTKNPT